MRIKDKVQFVLGIIDILLGITGIVLGFALHKEYKIFAGVAVLICGIIALKNGIETKRQRRKRAENEYNKRTQIH